MTKYAIFAALILTSGCTTLAARNEAARNAVNSWIGKHSDDLVAARGVPTATFQLSDGRRMYEYSTSETVTGGGGSMSLNKSVYIPTSSSGQGGWITVPQQQSLPVSSATYTCKALFRITQAGLIDDARTEGNDCYRRWH